MWRNDRLWAPVYAFALNRPPLTRLAGALVFRSDFGLLYDAFKVIGAQPDGASILDVPCGGGVALRGLSPHQRVRYVAADIATDMLARTVREAARLGLDQVETQLADMTALPFEDASFDLAVSFTGLHCVPDPETAVHELGRVTRPGGEVTGSLWLSDVAPDQRLIQLVARLRGLVGPSATQAQMERWLKDSGFQDPESRRSGDFLYFRARRR